MISYTRNAKEENGQAARPCGASRLLYVRRILSRWKRRYKSSYEGCVERV